MAGGRPTIYTPELLDKAGEYVANLPSDEVIHSIAGLACYLSISRETVYKWASEENEDKTLKKPEFSDIVVQILVKQEKALMNKGLTGDFNAAMAKLLLAKHGYTDKIDMTSKGDKLPTPILGVVPPAIQNAVHTDNSDEEDSESE